MQAELHAWAGGFHGFSSFVPTAEVSSHIDLTVPDASAAARWYAEVLGMQEVHRADLPERSVISLVHPGSHLVLGLIQHRDGTGDSFDEFRTGMDHIGFLVEDRAALEEGDKGLTKLGIDHSPVTDNRIGATVAFRDPDNIQLEFWANWPRPEG